MRGTGRGGDVESGTVGTGVGVPASCLLDESRSDGVGVKSSSLL